MKKTSKIITLILLITTFILIGSQTYGNDGLENLNIGGIEYTYKDGKGTKVKVPKTYVQKDKEFRGVWIATVWNIDIAQHTSKAQYQKLYREKLDLVQSMNMNAVLFQTRGFNDTYYESEYAPYSKTLTGTEGKDPGWDVMQFLVDETHARGLEFHVWMNPYRVSTSGFNPAALHDKNFAKQRPDLVIESTTAHILNPGEPEVREYIRDVVGEVMEKYPSIDGIHFDDYFYYGGQAKDEATYAKYGAGMSIGDFRRDNINQLIEALHKDIKKFNEDNGARVKFGISPSGIYLNGAANGGSNTNGQAHYNSHFIDTKKWVKNEWLDYITPQVYWQFGHPTAAYADVVKWWVDTVRGTKVDLIIGHSVSDGNWNVLERASQVLFNSQFDEIKGSIFYSLQNIKSAGRLEKVRNDYWTRNVPTIFDNVDIESPKISTDIPEIEGKYAGDVTITLESDFDIQYSLGGINWLDYTSPVTVDHHGSLFFYYRAINLATGDRSRHEMIIIDIERLNDDTPTISITGDTNDKGQFLGEATITIDAINKDNIEYYIMNGSGSVAEFIKYDGPIVSTRVNDHLVFARTVDGVTPSKIVEERFKIVENAFAAPTFKVTGIGTDPNYSQAKVELSSKADQIEYRINGGNWIKYTKAIEFLEEGDFKIDARNIDSKKEIVSKTIHIENYEAENAKIEIAGDRDGNNYINNATISFSGIEPNSKVFYKIYSNGSYEPNFRKYTGEFILDDNGINGVTWYTENAIGIKSEEEEKFITIQIELDINIDRVTRNGKDIKKANGETVMLPTSYVEKDAQVRAIWFSTVSNIDIGKMTSVKAYKEDIIGKLNKIKANNYNTIFFQVRPMNDAFYKSDYAPFSRYITGTEGKDPGFDVLGFVIEEAHKRGIELHAWLNPYRVSTGTGSIAEQIANLHKDNFAKKNPDLLLADSKGNLILNPGEPRVQEYLDNVIKELVEKYDVDGIHFDDYFYSYSGTPAQNDAAAYQANKNPNESLEDWRRRNVNTVVESVSKIIRNNNSKNNKKMKYGISPFGIWRNESTDPSGSHSNGLQSYDSQYADSKKWVEEGWLDYITPQLYWQFDNFGSNNRPIAPFADLVDWWYDLTQANDVGLVVGQGFYRLADGSWDYENEMIEQLRYLSTYDNLLGMASFTFNTLEKNDQSIKRSLEYMKNFYWKNTVKFPWESDVDHTNTNTDTDVEEELVPKTPNYLPWIIGAAGGVVIIASIVTVVIIVKKKNDDN